MKTSINLMFAGAVLVTIIVCTTALVALDKLSGDLYTSVVIGPSVAGIIAYVSHSKGVAQGSEASSDPPADS